MTRTLFKYAWRELFNHRRFAFFFVLNLSLGLIGFVLLLLTRDAVQNHFSSRLRDMLGADFLITSRQAPSADDQAWLEKTITESISRHSPKGTQKVSLHTSEMLTMVHSNKQSRLMRVIGVDQGFPLYGNLQLESNPKALTNRDELVNSLIANQQIWMDIPTSMAMEATIGDTLTLGTIPLTYGEKVLEHPSRSLGFTSLLPTVYVSRQTLDNSGLIAVGSRVLWKWAFRLETVDTVTGKASPFQESKVWQQLLKNLQLDFKAAQKKRLDGDRKIAVKAQADAAINEERFVMLVPEDTGRRLLALTNRISGFMNLISLIGLCFSGLGLGYLFRYYAHQRLQENAIARALGMTHVHSQILLLLQLVMLSLAALIIALGFGVLWSHLGLSWLSGLLGQTLSASLNPVTIFGLSALALLSSLVFTLPVMVRNRNIKPAVILRLLRGESLSSSDNQASFSERCIRALSVVPALLLLWLASVLLVDWYLGSMFFLLLVGVFLALGALLLFGINLAHRLSNKLSVNWRLAIRALYGRRYSSLSGLLAIALGVFLMALLPQMAATLRDEVRSPTQAALPAFFVFDIQSEQIEPLNIWIDSQKSDYPNIKLAGLSPQVRARITHINEALVSSAAVQKKIDARQQRFIRQGVNISYRDALSSTESILQGRALKPPSANANPDAPIEISLEDRYSGRLGVSLGDSIDFMIHGVPIKTVITNIRSVHWNSFRPNFFIIFPPGVLEAAPKTFIANMTGIPAADRQIFQGELSKAFSNISAVDVGALVEEILLLANQMLFAVYGLALIALVAGITVMISVALTEIESAEYEFGLIKVLGGGSKHLLFRAFAQFTLPTALAALLGFTMATILANLLAQTFLASSATYPWGDMMILISLVIILIILIFWGMAKRILTVKSGLLLNAD